MSRLITPANLTLLAKHMTKTSSRLSRVGRFLRADLGHEGFTLASVPVIGGMGAAGIALGTAPKTPEGREARGQVESIRNERDSLVRRAREIRSAEETPGERQLRNTQLLNTTRDGRGISMDTDNFNLGPVNFRTPYENGKFDQELLGNRQRRERLSSYTHGSY